MKLKSASEYLPALLQLRADENKIYIEDHHLVLDFDYKYEIHLDRIASPIDVIGWIHHLADKSWMTKSRIQMFIRKCGEINNRDYSVCG